MKRWFACKQNLECPLNNVKVLFSDPNKGQIIGENVHLGHDDLIGVGLPDLVQVEAAGVNDSEIFESGFEIQSTLNVGRFTEKIQINCSRDSM